MKHVTAKHEAEQERAAQAYAHALGVRMERAPGGTFSPIDYIARRPVDSDRPRYGDPIVEVVEIKCRSCGVGAFSTVWCEERKVKSLRYWADLYGATGYFVVSWADGEMRRIDVERLLKVCPQTFVAHRLDKRDDYDSDLVHAVPVQAMEVVVEGGGGIEPTEPRSKGAGRGIAHPGPPFTGGGEA